MFLYRIKGMRLIGKFILFIVSLISIAACNYEYCDICDRRVEYCICRNSYGNGDYFTASTLIGVWQIAYNEGYEKGLGFTPKQIEFFDGHKCDITYAKGREPDWLTDTYTYTYTSKYIKFNKGRTTFMFKLDSFTFPTLIVLDSFGRYEWHKKR